MSFHASFPYSSIDFLCWSASFRYVFPCFLVLFSVEEGIDSRLVLSVGAVSKLLEIYYIRELIL